MTKPRSGGIGKPHRTRPRAIPIVAIKGQMRGRHDPMVQVALEDAGYFVRKTSARQRGQDPEFGGLVPPARSGGGGLLSSRARASTTFGETTTQQNALAMQPLLQNKAFKDNTYRVHLKGARDGSGRTSGIRPYYTESGTRYWDSGHETVRNALSHRLMQDPGFSPLQAGGAPWGAENSHLARKAMHGPDDVLNAPPASVHQNTEMLAIETGVQHLEKTWRDGLRVKITGYVHDETQGELAGTLKAFRYKVLMKDQKGDWNKVFDRIGFGLRGNIDSEEARGLRDQVKALKPGSAVLESLKTDSFGRPLAAKGVHGNAPTEAAIRAGSGSSATSPMVTDMRHTNTNTWYVPSHALAHMEGIVQARAQRIK